MGINLFERVRSLENDPIHRAIEGDCKFHAAPTKYRSPAREIADDNDVELQWRFLIATTRRFASKMLQVRCL